MGDGVQHRVVPDHAVRGGDVHALLRDHRRDQQIELSGSELLEGVCRRALRHGQRGRGGGVRGVHGGAPEQLRRLRVPGQEVRQDMGGHALLHEHDAPKLLVVLELLEQGPLQDAQPAADALCARVPAHEVAQRGVHLRVVPPARVRAQHHLEEHDGALRVLLPGGDEDLQRLVELLQVPVPGGRRAAPAPRRADLGHLLPPRPGVLAPVRHLDALRCPGGFRPGPHGAQRGGERRVQLRHGGLRPPDEREQLLREVRALAIRDARPERRYQHVRLALALGDYLRIPRRALVRGDIDLVDAFGHHLRRCGVPVVPAGSQLFFASRAHDVDVELPRQLLDRLADPALLHRVGKRRRQAHHLDLPGGPLARDFESRGSRLQAQGDLAVGVLLENVVDLVEKHEPELAPSEQVRALRLGDRERPRRGDEHAEARRREPGAPEVLPDVGAPLPQRPGLLPNQEHRRDQEQYLAARGTRLGGPHPNQLGRDGRLPGARGEQHDGVLLPDLGDDTGLVGPQREGRRRGGERNLGRGSASGRERHQRRAGPPPRRDCRSCRWHLHVGGLHDTARGEAIGAHRQGADAQE
mmetsp:Transcript_92240/g.261122  ORF Transcript_92240/g.261122 Transcript_92240/m.261122 type:complete len:582 (+) Transcript_92240:580-2325(+)